MRSAFAPIDPKQVGQLRREDGGQREATGIHLRELTQLGRKDTDWPMSREQRHGECGRRPACPASCPRSAAPECRRRDVRRVATDRSNPLEQALVVAGARCREQLVPVLRRHPHDHAGRGQHIRGAAEQRRNLVALRYATEIGANGGGFGEGHRIRVGRMRPGPGGRRVQCGAEVRERRMVRQDRRMGPRTVEWNQRGPWDAGRV